MGVSNVLLVSVDVLVWVRDLEDDVVVKVYVSILQREVKLVELGAAAIRRLIQSKIFLVY